MKTFFDLSHFKTSPVNFFCEFVLLLALCVENGNIKIGNSSSQYININLLHLNRNV